MIFDLNLDERREVGLRLKKIRAQREMSVADLAERAQIPRSYIYALEAGRRLSVWNLRAVAVALRTTVDFLLGLESETSEGEGPCCPCCEVAADRDAWMHRFGGTNTYIRVEDSFVSLSQFLAGKPSVMGAVTGTPVRVIRCGVYEHEGMVHKRDTDAEY